jgi:hypothetical protein
MSIIDFILNLAGLLLWLNWRSLHFDPLLRGSPTTLVGTLKRAEPRRGQSWQLLGSLIALLFFRALLYWDLGSPADWTPKLNLGVVVLAFRSDSFPPASSFRATLLYSLLSFGRLLFVFYFWLFVLAVINHRSTEPDAMQRIIRLHLGRIGAWPWPLQLAAPLLVAAVLWLPLHPVLVSLDVLNPARSWAHVVAQGLLVSAGLVLTLEYLLPIFLLLYSLVSYVYLGSSPLWDFVSATARNLLVPIKSWRYGKLDFAPLAGTVLIVALLHWLPNLLLWKLLQRNLTLWPQ